MSFFTRLSSETRDRKFFSDEFRKILLDHAELLREASKKDIVKVEKGQLLRYRGNTKALLADLGIPTTLHWICSKINGFNSDFELPDDLESVIVPDSKFIEKLYLRWETKKK